MSYDLAVWDGERPFDDQTAGLVFRQLAAEHLRAESPAPLTQPLAGFVDALLRRWPDLTEDDELSPFSDGPLENDGAGPIIHFGMSYSRAEEVSADAARLADERGLVCFDPQRNCLRPTPDELSG